MARRIINNSLLDVKPQLNLLANGGFEQWSGSTSVLCNGYFNPAGPDSWGWGQGLSGDTVLTASKETSLQYKGSACLKMVITGTTAQGTSIGQFVGGSNSGDSGVVSFAKSVRGKVLSLSLAVKTTVAGKVKIRLRDDIGASDSSYHTGSGNWEILTVTRTIDSSAVYVAVFLGGMVSGDFSAGTYYMDAGMLVMGDRPVTFVPENPELDKVKSGAVLTLQQNVGNLIINGGFEEWTTPVYNDPLHYQPMMMGWGARRSDSGLVFSISRESINVDSGKYSLKLDITTAPASKVCGIVQSIENFYALYLGKTITVSCRVKTTAANCKLILFDGATTVSSAAHSGSGNWETLSVTRTITGVGAGTTYSSIHIGYYNSGEATVSVTYFDSVMMTVSDGVVPYVPPTPLELFDRLPTFNFFVNGGFEVWQRGTSFTNPVSGAYTADRWASLKDGSVAPTIDYSQATSSSLIDFGNGIYGMVINITAAGTGATTAGIVQYLSPDMNRKGTLKDSVQGSVYTVSAKVKTTLTNVRIRVSDGSGLQTFYSTPHTGSGSFETLSVTFSPKYTSGSNITTIIGIVDGVVTTGIIYVDSANLVYGEKPSPFVPEDKALELMRCQRYYQTIGNEFPTNQMCLTMKCRDTTTANAPANLPVTMAGTPNISFVGQTGFQLEGASGTLIATTGMSYGTLNPRGGRIQAIVAAGLVAGNCTLLYGNSTSYIEYSL